MSISFITSCISDRSMSKRLSIIFKRGQESKCSKTNYSPQGYWHKKVCRRGKVSDDAAKKWLIKQVIWQINLSAAKHIPRPKFDVSTPNTVHQADPFFTTWHSGAWSEAKNIQKRFDSGRCYQLFQRGRTLDLERLLESRAFFKKITIASLWIGHSCFRSTLAGHSWALSTKKWKNHIRRGRKKRFTGTR